MASVRHHNHQIGVGRRPAAALHAQLFHGVRRIADAGSIDKPQENAAADDGFFHRVAGGAGNISDDGPVIACQRVEQRGLTCVGQAHNGGGKAVFQGPAPLRRPQQVGQGGFGGLQGGPDLLGLNILNVLVGVIHHGVKPGGDVDEGFLHRLQTAAQTAVQLSRGVFRSGGGLGIDEIDDSLCLRQIHFAVEEGPLGEFPGLRLPRPGGKQGGKQLPQHHRGAMAVEFGGVLPGVAVSTAEADG